MKIETMRKRGVRSHERGQILPIFALMLVMLCGFAALAVDVSYWRYQQRLAQSAADSASIAAAAEIAFTTGVSDPTSQTNVKTAGKNDASNNGYTDGANNTSVVVNWSPSTGPNAGNAQAAEVIVSRVMPSFFIGALMPNFTQTIQARAVAKRLDTGGGCIYVMKGSISGDLTLNGGGRGGITTKPLCGVVVNGDMTVTGQANVDASFISYVGSGPKGGSYPHAQPRKGLPTSDPCARIPGCAYLASLPTSSPSMFDKSNCQDKLGILPVAVPLPGGEYCFGPYSTPVTLGNGNIYVLDKGMFSGPVYNTTGGESIYNNCTGSCDVTLNGSQVYDNLQAPTSGPSSGIVYYQSPTLTNNFTVNGASGVITDMGGIYAPGATFTFNGQLPTIAFLVAGDIRMNGGGVAAGSTLFNNTSVLNAVLVE